MQQSQTDPGWSLRLAQLCEMEEFLVKEGDQTDDELGEQVKEGGHVA